MKPVARIFGLVALIFACLGLFGSISMLVSLEHISIPLFYIALGVAGVFSLKYGAARPQPAPTQD